VYTTITPGAASAFTPRDRQLKRTKHRNARDKRKLVAKCHRAAAAFLVAQCSNLADELAAVDYDAPRDDPWAALPEAQRNAMDHAPARRVSVDSDGRYYAQRRRGRGEWSKPTRIDTSRRAFARTPRCGGVAAKVAGGRPAARRESHPGSRSTSRAASHGSGGRGGGGSDAGSDPPGGDDDDAFSDDETRHVAAHVAELFPAGLRKAQFNIAVWPWVSDLQDPRAERDAKAKIYAELPERLRMSILGDVLARGTERAAADERRGGGVRCRCCAQPFEPLPVVNEDGICPDCWDFPEDEQEVRDALQLGPGTWAPQEAADLAERKHDSERGAA
jgi:hypothetical protein